MVHPFPHEDPVRLAGKKKRREVVYRKVFPVIPGGAEITLVGVEGPYTQGQVDNGWQLSCTGGNYLANG